MIYGIGTDLCDVGRIEKSIARPAFCSMCIPRRSRSSLSPIRARSRRKPPRPTLLQRSILKACGTGLSGFSMAEIAALRQPSGAPYLEFTGKAARFMAQNHLQAHLSLTHEAGLAGAFVVLERVE